LATLAAKAGPARIVTVDVEQPLPDLRPDEHYRDAWVVLFRGGVPRSMVVLDLTIGASAVEGRLLELLTQARTSPGSVQGSALSDVELPRITVVVPTIVLRIEDLGQCIEALGKLEYPNFEVLLVDNRRVLPNPDPLPTLVQDRPWLRVLREPRPGVSAARNTGAAAASGEVVAFTDDDVRVDRQWLRAIGTRFALNPRVEAVTGLILPVELETPAQIWFERYYGGFSGERTFAPVTLEADASHQWLLGGSRVLTREANAIEPRRISVLAVGGYGAGANIAIRRSTLERIGGFDCALGAGTPSHGGEDLAMLISILWTGGQVGYEPAAFVYHRHRREYAELLKQMDGYGLGFTAMLTSLVRNDPRHLLSILSQLPKIILWKASQLADRIRGRRKSAVNDQTPVPDYPAVLFRREALAYLRGPRAYFRSRATWRKYAENSSR
jgi:glycosyltransferase involved in cell wall biosynthesis